MIMTCAMQVGMICSNEPGYYEDGAFGIRVENLLVITEADTEFRWGLCFTTDRTALSGPNEFKAALASSWMCRLLCQWNTVLQYYLACKMSLRFPSVTAGMHGRYGGMTFMGFEDLTLVPVQTKMIDPALLTPSEEKWLDDYHQKVPSCSVCAHSRICRSGNSMLCIGRHKGGLTDSWI